MDTLLQYLRNLWRVVSSRLCAPSVNTCAHLIPLFSVCRSCILRHLEASSYCPVCDVMIHRTKGSSSLKADRILQTMVYKMIPGLFRGEMKRRREFYQMKPYADPELPGWAKGDVDSFVPHVYTADEDVHVRLALFTADRAADSGTEESGEEPPAPVPPARYLRCVAGTPLTVLQKFVRTKFQMPQTVQVQLIYGSHVLPDDISLMDLQYMYNPSQDAAVCLSYRFVRRQRRTAPAEAELAEEIADKRPREDQEEADVSDTKRQRTEDADAPDANMQTSEGGDLLDCKPHMEEGEKAPGAQRQEASEKQTPDVHRLTADLETLKRPLVLLERMFDVEDEEPTSPQIVEDIIASLDAAEEAADEAAEEAADKPVDEAAPDPVVSSPLPAAIAGQATDPAGVRQPDEPRSADPATPALAPAPESRPGPGGQACGEARESRLPASPAALQTDTGVPSVNSEDHTVDDGADSTVQRASGDDFQRPASVDVVSSGDFQRPASVGSVGSGDFQRPASVDGVSSGDFQRPALVDGVSSGDFQRPASVGSVSSGDFQRPASVGSVSNGDLQRPAPAGGGTSDDFLRPAPVDGVSAVCPTAAAAPEEAKAAEKEDRTRDRHSLDTAGKAHVRDSTANKIDKTVPAPRKSTSVCSKKSALVKGAIDTSDKACVTPISSENATGPTSKVPTLIRDADKRAFQYPTSRGAARIETSKPSRSQAKEYSFAPGGMFNPQLHVNTSMASRLSYDMAMRNLLTLSHMAMAQGGMVRPPMFPMQAMFPPRPKSQDFHPIPDPSLLRQQSEARMGAASKKASPTAGSTAPQLRTPTALTSASIQHMEDLTRTLGKRPEKQRHSVTVTAIPSSE
ncbi:uncharacterized protein LOC119109763 [Pollicipes pollicipes]|uniref:uncharacterized protein LOC119109763 n=1 Tax=Pollicipes pollicipes TaxID=41117 RepID=UPI001884C4FC|nr:uncharacterized protein LOC119109763 [Pollicipes pollicipes]